MSRRKVQLPRCDFEPAHPGYAYATWEGWTTSATRRQVLTDFAGYILSLAEMPSEDDETLDAHLMEDADNE